MKWQACIWIEAYGRWMPMPGRVFATRGWAQCFCDLRNLYATVPYRVFPV